jgi:Protein of unknown function (DUF4230)
MRHQTSSKPINPVLHLIRSLGLIVTGGSIMVGALLLLGLWQSGDRFLAKLAGFLTPPKAEPQVDVRSVVVKQVQDASELTTAIFTMEAVVPTQQDNNVAGLVIGSTKLLYIAYGQVRAGVDLSQLKPTDVVTTPTGISVRLPAARLLDSKIDVSRSNVYDYNRGFLGLGPDTAPTLQTLAQQKALEKIVDAACREGILQKATDRARLVVSQLVTLPGQQVVVEAAPIGDCKVMANAAAALPPASTTPIAPLPSTVPLTMDPLTTAPSTAPLTAAPLTAPFPTISTTPLPTVPIQPAPASPAL